VRSPSGRNWWHQINLDYVWTRAFFRSLLERVSRRREGKSSTGRTSMGISGASRGAFDRHRRDAKLLVRLKRHIGSALQFNHLGAAEQTAYPRHIDLNSLKCRLTSLPSAGVDGRGTTRSHGNDLDACCPNCRLPIERFLVLLFRLVFRFGADVASIVVCSARVKESRLLLLLMRKRSLRQYSVSCLTPSRP
jgi:hypothetical protein